MGRPPCVHGDIDLPGQRRTLAVPRFTGRSRKGNETYFVRGTVRRGRRDLTVLGNTATALPVAAGGFVSLIVVVALITLLVLREIGSVEAAGDRRRIRLRFFVKASNGPILALFGVFIAVLVVQVLTFL